MIVDHLTKTFSDTERTHPDLMEPYSSRLAEAETADVRRAIMEEGLRDTFKKRYPMPDGFWPKAMVSTVESAS